MKFSVCIPNFNYEKYLGRTIQSVLDQTYFDFEILVSDNVSTDRSVEIVRGFGDPRIKLQINACNVGFAGNLDKSASMATGQRIIMLSSDDLMLPDALAVYHQLYERLGDAGDRAIISSTWDVIDGEDRVMGKQGPLPTLWKEADRQPDLEALLGAPVYGVRADELLRRCLREMKNPFNFAATVYSQQLYKAVEGYGGGRLINPDKWFHWKILSVADMAYFIDRRLFAYRWHSSNQLAQETGLGVLKFLVDDYVSSFEIDAKVLARLNLTRDDIAAAYVEHDIARHGLASLGRGERTKAWRIKTFGRATYPRQMRRNLKAWALGGLLCLGPIGTGLARWLYARQQRQDGLKNGD